MTTRDPLAGTNLTYVEALYAQYLEDPSSVDGEWQQYFSGLGSNGDVHAVRRSVDGPSRQPTSIFHKPSASKPAPAPRPRAADFLPPAETSAAPTPTSLPEVPQAELDQRLGFLRDTGLFRSFSDAEIELVARLAEEVRLADDTFLFHEGDPGDSLYLVMEGRLIIRRRDGVVVHLQEGQVVGELAVFATQPRVADAIARGEIRLLKLLREDLMALLERRPSLAEGFLRLLSERLRQSQSRQDKVNQLIHAHRVRGHLLSQLDPLGQPRGPNPELELEHYGLSENDLDNFFSASMLGSAVRGGNSDRAAMTLRDILGLLRSVYCNEIGVQFMHIDDVRAKLWIQGQMENPANHRRLSRDEQLRILTKLNDAELFEQFIHRKFLGAKRFSLEGGETLIPLLDLTLEDAGRHGVREVVIGMAHRGRLNVLVNVMGKSAADVFHEFADANADEYIGRGDVKYHMGYSSNVQIADDEMHLSLCFNPSHLEFVDPVAVGRVRAKQDRFGDRDRRRGMGILIHGDAAFAGQGVIQELFNLSGLDGYDTGGTVHIIVNNQIGFTTPPESSRTTDYATDVARMLQTPIFHVNGESPEAVAQVVRWAMDYRAEFGKDVIIDMYCYRRYGHNEGDEPGFTQPLLYDVIRKRKSVVESYVEHLLAIGEVKREEADEIAVRLKEELEAELSRSRAPDFKKRTAMPELTMWEGYQGGLDRDAPEVNTTVPAEKLSELLRATTRIPEDFNMHRKLKGFMKNRLEMADGEKSLDWSAGEALALASILAEGRPVRFSGQDSTRGTFSHRHALLHDTKTGATFMPLHEIAPGKLQLWDSPLSEVGVLGFEYGYSLDSPDGLCIWEAQFGDFCNVAQVIIDQFITSSEDKWNRLSGLAMFLPHGFEGQGPEHSSARLERFLTMSAEDNIQVVNLTTPAQLFHCLRRQVLRPWRKPLIVMSPKSLLRHKRAVSSLDDLASGSFQRILPDTDADPKKIKKILLVSGKLYYELAEAREEGQREDVAILRLEQYYPLSEDTVRSALAPYSDKAPVVWVQEEPENMGAQAHVLRLLRPWLGGRLSAVSRPESASPATGSKAAHDKEQARVVNEAFA